MTRRNIGLWSLEILTPILILTLWWFASANSTSVFYPPLSTIGQAFADTWLPERLASDLVPSLVRLAIGFAAAAVLGIVIGLALGRAQLLASLCRPILEFFRFIPPPVTAPIFVVIFGIGDVTKVLFIVFGATWPILMNAMDGARAVDSVQLDAASVMGFSRWQRFRQVIWPASLPRIFTGLRNGLAVAVIVMVVGEMLGSTNGVGYLVLEAQRTFQVPQMWAGMLMLGIIGYLLNLLFLAVERRTLYWYRGLRGTLDPARAASARMKEN